MLAHAVKPLVRLVDQYLPDPYIFVLILTLIVMVAAMAIEGHGPVAVIGMWGDGFWDLLAFSMQMLLVLVTGFMLASTPPVKRVLVAIARTVKSPGAAILTVSLVSLVAHWINWGFGLIVSALFAKEVARLVRVDYRLLIASAYSGFVIWHGGLSGSVPLSIATPGHPFEALTGVIGTGQTTFAFFNLAIVAALFVVVPLVNRLDAAERCGQLLRRSCAATRRRARRWQDRAARGSARDEPQRLLARRLAGIRLARGLFRPTAADSRSTPSTFSFLTLAILLHGTPRRLLASLQEAIKGGGGIVIQFPFYAGIMGIMVGSGLADTMSKALLSVASERTLPFLVSFPRASSISSCLRAAGSGQSRPRRSCRPPMHWARTWLASRWPSPGAMHGRA